MMRQMSSQYAITFLSLFYAPGLSSHGDSVPLVPINTLLSIPSSSTSVRVDCSSLFRRFLFPRMTGYEMYRTLQLSNDGSDWRLESVIGRFQTARLSISPESSGAFHSASRACVLSSNHMCVRILAHFSECTL